MGKPVYPIAILDVAVFVRHDSMAMAYSFYELAIVFNSGRLGLDPLAMRFPTEPLTIVIVAIIKGQSSCVLDLKLGATCEKIDSVVLQ